MDILIIDDDLRQRELLQEIFTDNGYDVTACGDSRDALICLENERFDSIITDLKMPHINGTEILKVCQQKDSDQPCQTGREISYHPPFYRNNAILWDKPDERDC